MRNICFTVFLVHVIAGVKTSFCLIKTLKSVLREAVIRAQKWKFNSNLTFFNQRL